MGIPYPGFDSWSVDKDWAARAVGSAGLGCSRQKHRAQTVWWVEGEARGACWTEDVGRAVLRLAEQRAVGGVGRAPDLGFWFLGPGHHTPPSACCSSCLSVSLSIFLAHGHPSSDGSALPLLPHLHCGPG